MRRIAFAVAGGEGAFHWVIDTVASQLYAFIAHKFAIGVCGASGYAGRELCELIAHDANGGGLGRRVVAELEALARMRGIVELFALTMTAGFFESVGYEVTERSRYPAKLRRDCASCARRSACDEICVARMFRADKVEFAA